MKLQDRLLIRVCKWSAYLLLLSFIALFVALYLSSHLNFSTFGLHFLISTVWDPVTQHFGALTSILGTIITSTIAVILALPISLGVAIFATDMVPNKITTGISVGLQILAGIPSIIYGMWGLFIITPIFALYVEPLLANTLGQIPALGLLFSGTTAGLGILTAGFILAIMIIPL